MTPEFNPKASGYAILAGLAVVTFIILTEWGKNKIAQAASAIGLEGKPVAEPPQVIANEASSLDVSARIVSPSSGSTAKMDDWITPSFPLTVRLVANKDATANYSIEVRETPPLGAAVKNRYGPFVGNVGPKATLYPHNIPRQTSLLQGSPLAEATVFVGSTPEHTVTFTLGT